MSKDPKNLWKFGEILGERENDGENLHIFWTTWGTLINF